MAIDNSDPAGHFCAKKAGPLVFLVGNVETFAFISIPPHNKQKQNKT